MNIYQKLIECRKSVPFLAKDNSGYQFKYVSSSQTLGALREAMDAQGLLLVPRLVSERVLDHTTKKGDHNYFTVLNMEFTWVNAEKPEETVVCPWIGQGLDDGEKGVGKALTYAEKFFLLKFFNIPTDKEDPDANQRQPETKKSAPVAPPKPSPPPPVSTDAENGVTDEPLPVGTELRTRVDGLIDEAGIDKKLFKAWLFSVKKIGKKFGNPSLSTMKVQTAESMIAVWPQTMKAFSLWMDKKNEANIGKDAA